MAAGTATVKSIQSGDSIIVVGKQTDPKRSPPELKLSLSSTVAPKLAMKSAAQQTDDEPWAWECREALRELVIGKAVDFKVDYVIGDRQYATIKIGGKNVAEYLIGQGFAKVMPGKNASPELEALQAAEGDAMAKHVGQHGGNGGKGIPRSMQYHNDEGFDGKGFFEANKKKMLPCVVEWVRDAGHCRVLLLPQGAVKSYTLVGLNFSGLQVEGFKRDPDTREEKAEGPTSHSAKHFLEFRVLHRKLEVRLEATDQYGNMSGTLYHPRGVISKFLAQEGFAKVGGPALGETECASELRELMKEAQANKKGRWATYEAPTLTGKTNFHAKVIEVVSGDCVVVKDLEDGSEERRVYFSSTKAPKMGRRDTKDEAYAWEAKEFLRKKFVGKKVKVSIEYSREMRGPGGVALEGPAATMGPMYFASIFDRTMNLAEEVIAKGFALYQRHRADDETSEHLDALMTAEKKAEEAKLGLFNTVSAPPAHRYNDLVGTENSSKAKQLSGSLMRMGKAAGVVEYVFNAGRFKVRVDKESLFIPMCLAGVKVPQTAQPARKKSADPFGPEAYAFVREMIMHQDIEVEVHTTDRGGNCLGSVWYKGDGGKPKLLAETLLEMGFAKTVEYSLAGVPYADQLTKAEAKAKASGDNIWSLPQEEYTEGTGATQKNYPAVEVCHINGVNDFFVQECGDPALGRIMGTVQNAAKVPGNIEFRRNVMVLAEFQKEWYRAQVTTVGPVCEVLFVDFGNTDMVAQEKLRPCPGNLSLASEPARAIHCTLSGIKTTKDFENDAGMCFQSYASGTFKCNIEGSIGNRGCAILTPATGGTTVNEKIVKEGVARVDPKCVCAVKTQMEKVQQDARRARLYMWRHGDNYDDDEEDWDRGGGRF